MSNKLTLNKDDRSLYINNNIEISLTKNEYYLVEFLMEHKNKVYSRKELIKGIHKVGIALRTIDAIVSRLRRKLAKYGIEAIKTKIGFGYKWVVN